MYYSSFHALHNTYGVGIDDRASGVRRLHRGRGRPSVLQVALRRRAGTPHTPFIPRPTDASAQGLAKGSNIPIIGAVQVAWYTPHAPNGAAAQKPAPASTEAAPAPEPRAPSPPPPPEDTNMLEEEVGAGGWGDGDDEFGLL